MKFFQIFSKLRRDAAIESGKITFAVLGVGSTLAQISVMHVTLMIVSAALVLGTWAAIYRICE